MTEEATTRETITAYEEGKAAERARIAAIVESPEAEGRRDLAVHLALHTNMNPEQAASLMSKAPRPQQGPALH